MGDPVHNDWLTQDRSLSPLPPLEECQSLMLVELTFIVYPRFTYLERFQEKWTRFSVRKRDQTGNLEHFHESINLGNALGRRIARLRHARRVIESFDRSAKHFNLSVGLALRNIVRTSREIVNKIGPKRGRFNLAPWCI